VTARILVAEDDPKQANLIRIYLEREGHQIRVVGDGRTAARPGRPCRRDHGVSATTRWRHAEEDHDRRGGRGWVVGTADPVRAIVTLN
jgi:CheY-like chemotaxis protein